MRYRIRPGTCYENARGVIGWRLQRKGWFFWHDCGIWYPVTSFEYAEERVKQFNESEAT